MSARLTHVFENDPLAAPVTADLRAFVALAVKVTARPQEVTSADVRAAFASAISPRQYFDAVGVMITFNFITRVANSLGVEPEIPCWMRRIEPLRRLGLRAMALFFRMFVDLGRQAVHGPTPAEHLAALRALFLTLRLGTLPQWVERLSFAPPLLAALRELLESLVRRDATTGTIGLDANLFMAIGRTVLQSIPNAGTLTALVENWQPTNPVDEDPRRIALIARFAKDVATRSYVVTHERIDELRSAGLSDAEVLDAAATAALWSAAARLEVLTGCLPAFDASDSEARTDASARVSQQSPRDEKASRYAIGIGVGEI